MPTAAVARLTAALATIALAGPIALAAPPPALAADPTPTTTPTPTPTPAPIDPALGSFYSQQLTWSACRQAPQCAWLTVPLDYAHPDAATIRLRVSKVPATGASATRLGSLVVNPGGPGAGGLDFATYVATLSTAVSRQYDVVGFDTRGVGESAAITCMTGAQTTRWLRADPTPDTAAERQAYMRLAGRIPTGCLAMSPTVAGFVGSENTVRDLDILRQALGDERLNWLGFSYGTYLGSRYAQQFPDRLGRVVLDGAVDPQLDGMQVSAGQSRGFQVAVARFAKDCTQFRGCPWRSSTRAVLTGINRLLSRLDSHPMRAHRGRPLVQAEAISAIFLAMYSPSFWPPLRKALAQAAVGDGTGLQTLADYGNERIGPNTYASNMASAFPAIACWDSTPAPGATGLAAAARTWSANAAVPELAVAMAWGNAPCTTWYGHSPFAATPVSSTTTAPILVIGTVFDPATPDAWAKSLAGQLPTSTLLTFTGDGHTAYGGNSRCIDRAVDTYLLTGTPPAPGTVCR